MFLTDEEIIDQIKEYVTDDRYKQAVLIDGDWGCGKTYFVQEKLIDSLEEKNAGNTENSRKILYISLYGMETLSQILDEVYSKTIESFIDEKLGEGSGQIIEKGISITTKLVLAGMKCFNIEKDDLPKLSDIKKIKDAIIIFDDLERCSIDTNQLFGFINNLVEHNSIKIVIVANQVEMGKCKQINDLPAKYNVVLNSNLILNKSVNKSDNDQSKILKQLEVKELQAFTEKVFSEDFMYEKVKEKLIGLTINYRANLNDIYEEIINKYINHVPLKEYLNKNKKFVLSIFDKRQHYNIRTMIFALMAYEKVYISVSKIEFNPNNFLLEQYEKILNYIVELSIQIKKGEKKYSWINTTSQAGSVFLEKSDIYGESIYGYRFIDTYLTTRFLDTEEVNTIIFGIMIEEKKVFEYRVAENALSYNMHDSWWYLEDYEVYSLIDTIKNELAEKKYHPRYFKDIIIMLMQINRYNFIKFNFQETCDDYVMYMKQCLTTLSDDFESEILEVLSDNVAFINEYNLIMKPLFDILNKKESEEKEKINKSFNLDESWGNFFKACCKENKDLYMDKKKFLLYVNPEKVIEKLRTSMVRDIYSFLEGIEEIYSFSNLNDFFEGDIEHINIILRLLNIDELSDDKITRRIVLEKLKRKLEESRDLIYQPYKYNTQGK